MCPEMIGNKSTKLMPIYLYTMLGGSQRVVAAYMMFGIKEIEIEETFGWMCYSKYLTLNLNLIFEN